MSPQIGLAVGDIEAIQKTAFLRNKGKQITFIADIERKFPIFFTRRMYQPSEIVRVDLETGKFWKLVRFDFHSSTLKLKYHGNFGHRNLVPRPFSAFKNLWTRLPILEYFVV